jgi:hypothetical protein
MLAGWAATAARFATRAPSCPRSAAAAAKDALNYTDLKGRQIFIQWIERDPSKRRTGHATVFVKVRPHFTRPAVPLA